MSGLLAWVAAGALAADVVGGDPLPTGPLGQPSPETLVYYNARMALAEDQPLEAVKLWLLRNSLADRTGHVSAHDPDFHSVTWAALGELGICMDGLVADTDGAGLWPIAMHDWVVKNMSRIPARNRPRPFDAFRVGRQQRFVSIGDVLGGSELHEVELFRGRCARPQILLALSGEAVNAKLSDRQVAARFLLHLVDQADRTLDPALVRGRSVLAARRFDLHLQLAALSRAAARADARDRGRLGRQLGLSRASAQALVADAPEYQFAPDSPPAQVLEAARGWPVEEWMALSPERRRFLFVHARTWAGDPLDPLLLGILDALVAAGDGAEVERWIGLRGDADPEAVWGGDRGARLLALDTASGFRERAPIALRRGVRELEGGDLGAALRSFAYALQRAPESAAGDDVSRVARRWLSFVAGQFEVTDELLGTLRALVPVRDYATILEDLLWRSTFAADAASFELAFRNQPGKGALERRAATLRPLAKGDVRAFVAGIRAGLAASPSETFRLLDQLLLRLELEDAGVREAQVPTLLAIEQLLGSQRGEGRVQRTLDRLGERSRAIREGVGSTETPWDALVGEVRGLAPGTELFVGPLRLAPADPLPWPFRPEDVSAPSVFEPIDLVPVLWRDDAGALVFGWTLRG